MEKKIERILNNEKTIKAREKALSLREKAVEAREAAVLLREEALQTNLLNNEEADHDHITLKPHDKSKKRRRSRKRRKLSIEESEDEGEKYTHEAVCAKAGLPPVQRGITLLNSQVPSLYIQSQTKNNVGYADLIDKKCSLYDFAKQKGKLVENSTELKKGTINRKVFDIVSRFGSMPCFLAHGGKNSWSFVDNIFIIGFKKIDGVFKMKVGNLLVPRPLAINRTRRMISSTQD